MKTTRTFITFWQARPKRCSGCDAKITYQRVKKQRRTKKPGFYRFTKHQDWCPLVNKNRKNKPGDRDKKMTYQRPKEKDLTIIPLKLRELSTVKFEKAVNQYLKGER